LIIIRIFSWAANQHIRMTSEGSWDCSNDAIYIYIYIYIYILIYNKNIKWLFKIIILFRNITIFTDQINAELMSIREFFQKQ